MVRNPRVSSKPHARGRTKGPHLYQRGATWWAYLGDGARESLKTTDAEQARERFAEKLRTPRSPRIKEEALEMIAKAYLEAPHGWTKTQLHSQQLRVCAWVEAMLALGVQSVSGASHRILDAWRESRMSVVSRATINRDETAANACCKWSLKTGLIKSNPFAGREQLREPVRQTRRVVPDVATVVAVARWLEHGHRPTSRGRARRSQSSVGAALAILVGLATGLRLDELRHLRKEHISDNAVRVVPETGTADESWTTKGYRERAIPVTPAVASLARRWCAWKASAKGDKGKPVGLSQLWLYDAIDRAVAALWSEDQEARRFRPHDLRRLFATTAVRAGIPADVVQQWLGHRDLQTTQRYIVSLASDVAMVAPAPMGVE